MLGLRLLMRGCEFFCFPFLSSVRGWNGVVGLGAGC